MPPQGEKRHQPQIAENSERGAKKVTKNVKISSKEETGVNEGASGKKKDGHEKNDHRHDCQA